MNVKKTETVLRVQYGNPEVDTGYISGFNMKGNTK